MLYFILYTITTVAPKVRILRSLEILYQNRLALSLALSEQMITAASFIVCGAISNCISHYISSCMPNCYPTNCISNYICNCISSCIPNRYPTNCISNCFCNCIFNCISNCYPTIFLNQLGESNILLAH
jgi:hypothetical protein